MSKEYKILERRSYDEYSELTSKKYYVKKKVKFLFFWERWKIITHDIGISTHFKVNTKFDTEKEAIDFAKKCICNDRPYNTNVYNTVKTISCNEQD